MDVEGAPELGKGKLEGFKLRLEYSEPFVIGRNPTEIGI